MIIFVNLMIYLLLLLLLVIFQKTLVLITGFVTYKLSFTLHCKSCNKLYALKKDFFKIH